MKMNLTVKRTASKGHAKQHADANARKARLLALWGNGITSEKELVEAMGLAVQTVRRYKAELGLYVYDGYKRRYSKENETDNL